MDTNCGESMQFISPNSIKQVRQYIVKEDRGDITPNICYSEDVSYPTIYGSGYLNISASHVLFCFVVTSW